MKVRLASGIEADLFAAFQKSLNLLQAESFSCLQADQQSSASPSLSFRLILCWKHGGPSGSSCVGNSANDDYRFGNIF
jgi:hypothetical protein